MLLGVVARPAEAYKITFPTIYACGLFLGKLRMEIGGDPCTIRCESSNLEAKIEFVQEVRRTDVFD